MKEMSKDYIIGILEVSGTFIIKKMEDYKNPHGNGMIQRNAYQFKAELNVKGDSCFLTKIKEYLNIGIINNDRYIIAKKSDVKKLIRFLGGNPFISNKKYRYKTWKKAFLHYNKNTGRGFKNHDFFMKDMEEMIRDD